MNELKDEQIVKFMKKLFKDEANSWDHFECKVSKNTKEEIKFSINRMYEYVSINLGVLMQMAEFFGTKKINEDQYSSDGCDTCDYGSRYTYDFTVQPE